MIPMQIYKHSLFYFKNMGKRISNYAELPLPNKKIYDLVLLHADGNVSSFAELVGVKQQVLDRIFKKDNRNGKYPSVSTNIKDAVKKKFKVDDAWFFLEEDGETRNEDTISNTGEAPADASYKLVPVIHIDSVGGMYSSNAVSLSESQYVEGYVPFMNAREGDRAIFQTGTSMIPTCPPGSLMQIRKVNNWKEYFGFGNIFVIELSDGRRITKEVNKCESNPKDYVVCHSHNKEVSDEELPKDMIVSVWKVIKILTDKGW